MSKIICDVCGTSYQETANQCPICGCVRAGEVKTVTGDTNKAEVGASGTYTYVKGGRFSKANVRKRNRENQNSGSDRNANAAAENKNGGSSDKGLTIAVVVLLLAVVAVVLYIMIRIFGGGLFTPSDSDKPDIPGASTTESAPSTELNIPCTGLTLDNPSVELQKKDSAYLLNVTVAPADTTDEILYASENDKIATVSADGKITAVGAGETKIIITCGSVEIECVVVCSFEEETTDPSTEETDPSTEETDPSTEETDPTTEPTEPDADFKLNREDFTLAAKGASWMLYDGDAPELITWTSDNESVATIENGKVVAVGPGVTTVHGEYNGVKLSCIVRCSFSVSTTDTPSDEPVQNTEPSMYTMSHEDVTIIIGESFTLQLLDANGKPVEVTWRTSDSLCSISGNRITGVSTGTAKVYATYDGREYSCIVRVYISR